MQNFQAIHPTIITAWHSKNLQDQSHWRPYNTWAHNSTLNISCFPFSFLAHIATVPDSKLSGSPSIVVGMRNVPHKLECLNIWSLAGGTVWESHGTFRRRSLTGGSGLLGVGLEFSRRDPNPVHSDSKLKMQGGNQTPVISARHALCWLSRLSILKRVRWWTDDGQMMDRWTGNRQINKQMGRSEVEVRSP